MNMKYDYTKPNTNPLIRAIASLALGCCLHSGVVHAQTGDSASEFVIVTDMFHSLFGDAPVRQDNFESFSITWDSDLSRGGNFILQATTKPIMRDGVTIKGEISAHSYEPMSTGRKMELITREFIVEKGGQRKLTQSHSCKFEEAYRPGAFISRDAFSARFEKGCYPAAGMSFQIVAYRQPTNDRYQACVEEGVKVAKELDKTKQDLARTQQLATATGEDLKRSRATFDKLVSVTTPYLKKVVETLKDRNNFYLELRREAGKVLSAVEAAQQKP